MIISETWLREFVDPPQDAESLAQQMTMAGLEVESINILSGDFENVVVGEIVSVKGHPNADKLKVCEVDAGDDHTFLVVCGAPNAVEGLRVPFARVGALLPGNKKIKSVELRGVKSAGMLCAEKELGLSDLDDGLMELSPEASIGEDLKIHLDLPDNLFEIGLTPNRADCLSIIGVAREIATLNGLALKVQDSVRVPETHEEQLSIVLEADEFCPIYLGRIIHGVDLNRATPGWMREKLRRSGIRSINAVVDVTNYVMLELGQPMHAFDFSTVSGNIVVRQAKSNEELVLLNESKIVLNSENFVIADENEPLALAGIMGGQKSSVNKSTTSIFLEAAFFTPNKISGKARAFGLHTDSSHRFERGVDIQIQRDAIEFATELIINLVGGQAGKITEARELEKIPLRETVDLKEASITNMLGFKMPVSDVQNILISLGFELTKNPDGWSCSVPSWRFDITQEADLLEELARIFGYNKLPVASIKSELSANVLPESRLTVRRIRRQLASSGYFEAITYSFQNPNLQSCFDPENLPIKLINPISEDMSVMRTSLIPGLLQALVHNLNRQRQRICLFETGLVFNCVEGAISQSLVLSMILAGKKDIECWANNIGNFDFFDIKGHLEELFSLTGRLNDFSFSDNKRVGFHPGQVARIIRNGESIGWVGCIHPEIASELGVGIPIFAAEVQLDALVKSRLPKFHEVSKYPEIRRDIAIIVDKAITAKQIMSEVRSAAGEKLIDLTLFDLYSGEGIDPKRKSVALGLTFCDRSSTLEDKDIVTALESVVASLSDKLGAELR